MNRRGVVPNSSRAESPDPAPDDLRNFLKRLRNTLRRFEHFQAFHHFQLLPRLR